MSNKVYLLANWNLRKFKIGRTQRMVEQRVEELQVGNGERLEVVHVFETPYANRIEANMHHYHAAKGCDGGKEWFNLTEDDISNFMEHCQKYHDNIKVLVKAGNPFINPNPDGFDRHGLNGFNF